MDLARPPGAALADLVELESFETVLRTGREAIGPIAAGPRGPHAFAVRVPILRDGNVVSVLTGVIEPAAISEILTTQQIPADWVGTVFDSALTVVARTRGTEQFIGRAISPEFTRLLSTTQEGWAITHTLEGAPMYTAFSRSPATGWGVGIGIPPATIDAPLRRSLWAVAGGGVGFLVAAVVLSLLVGQRIARPVVALSSAVSAFRQRLAAPPPVPRGGPQEIAAVARAFDEAMTSAQSARAEAEAANRAKDRFPPCSRTSCGRRSTRCTAGRASSEPPRSIRPGRSARSTRSSATRPRRSAWWKTCSTSRGWSPARCDSSSAR